jgi:hypothetical protein
MNRRALSTKAGLAVAIMAAIGGVLLNRVGAWIVHHDSINYSLPLPVRNAAELAFALGPVLWVTGIILAAPLALGWVRGVGAFWKLVGIEAFAYCALLCGLGSVGALDLLWLAATVLLWVAALVVAVICPALMAPGATPSGGPAMGADNPDTKEGPPLVI